MLNESKWDIVHAHGPFLGHTGFANHACNFFTELNKQIPVRVRNFTHTSNIDYLTQSQKDMVIHQTWNDVPWEIGTPFIPNPKDKILNIILMETNHYYFYDNYVGPKIAYSVWESTRQPDQFFDKLKEYDQIWVPTEWQRQCTIEQGMPAEKVFVVPEGVDLERFHPIERIKDKTKFQFMIFGRWDYRKYTKEMVKAFLEEFGKDEPVELILSADNPFPVDTYHSTEERLEKYGLKSPRIKILHFPSDEEYTRYLQTGDCLLTASRSEGWNLPAIESLACGTPTLITDWGAPLEFGKYAYKVKVKEMKKPENVFMQSNDVPGLWAEPDYDDLKKQMRYIYENHTECLKYTLDNIDFVQSFTWKNAADKAMEIINNIDIETFYPLKLNVGSGEYPQEGYVNVDKYYDKADVKADALDLPYDTETVQEVLSSHLLEHFNKYEVKKALSEWYRVLKYDGKLELEVPDFESILRNWLEAEDKLGFAMDTVFGLQNREGEEHKFGFTTKILNEMLLDVGFSDVEIKNTKSHAQDCIHAIAYKKDLKYDDDIFVIDCFPNTEEKMGFLRDSIERTKKIGKPIAIVTHYVLPEDIIKEVDYVIYDKHNPLSENYSLTFWATLPKTLKVVTSLTNSYHGLCCLTSMKNATTYLKDKYKFLHFIEYDTEVKLDEYLKTSNYHRARGKKFVCFDYHYPVPKQDGLITNIFSVDTNWFDEKMILLRDWKDYLKEAYEINNRNGKGADAILEHWMWNYFSDRDMLKDTQILTKAEKDTLIIRGNMKDQMDEEPEMHFRLSETDDHRLILFIMRDDRTGSSAWYKVTHNNNVYEGNVRYGWMEWIELEKNGIVSVESEHFKKEFIIDPDHTYKESIFRFYDDHIKCIEWDSNHDKDFMYHENLTPSGDKIKYTFTDGAKVEIIGNSKSEYEIEFINRDTGITTYKTKITANHWSAPSTQYYVNWNVIIRENGKEVSKHEFDCRGKNVLIQLDSIAIGDTIAWVPYILEFKKKHVCNVYGRTFHNYMFKETYPEIHWIDINTEPKEEIYAYYNIGCRDNDYNSNKNNWRSIELPKVCCDYLGLDYKEIRPKVSKPKKERPIKEPYVCISEHSTFQAKYWLFPGGWQLVVDYLNARGYKVVVISKEPTTLKNIINRTGRTIEDTINTIRWSELFIGVSSGPTWLAWALDVPVVLISGYSEKWGEFQDNCARISAPEGKCHGCFNDRDAVLDRGNWNWCPRSKNFECTTSITPEMVIRGIGKFLK